MTDRIQVNAKKLLSISLSLITGAVLAQNSGNQTVGEEQLKSDQSVLEADQHKLARDEATLNSDESSISLFKRSKN